jgi:hypothetical protein
MHCRLVVLLFELLLVMSCRVFFIERIRLLSLGSHYNRRDV